MPQTRTATAPGDCLKRWAPTCLQPDALGRGISAKGWNVKVAPRHQQRHNSLYDIEQASDVTVWMDRLKFSLSVCNAQHYRKSKLRAVLAHPLTWLWIVALIVVLILSNTRAPVHLLGSVGGALSGVTEIRSCGYR